MTDDASRLTQQHKAQALKEKLLDCVTQENQNLSEKARTFFDKPRKTEADKKAALESVVASAKYLLSAGDWDSSLFLRAQAKRIKAVKEEAEAELHRLAALASAKNTAGKIKLADDECIVYISLFQTDGYNLEKWALQLRSLARYVVGRPVYANAGDVEKRIRLRAASINEAYVAVAIKKADVRETDPNDLASLDQFGHVLLHLADDAVAKGRIHSFVHQGVSYRFVDGRLVKSA